MNNSAKFWTDKNIETILGNLLRVGVLLAGILVFAGGIHYLLQYGNATPEYSVFKSEPQQLRNPVSIFRDAIAFHHDGVIQLGLILLIATPVARVFFSVIAFIFEKDYMYVVFTLIVLSVLLYSLFNVHF